MDSDGRQAQFAAGVAESQRILAGMRTETQTNDRAVAQSREIIREAQDLLRGTWDSCHAGQPHTFTTL